MADLKIPMDLLDKPWKRLRPTVEKSLNTTPFKKQYTFPADLPAEAVIVFPSGLEDNHVARERLYYAALDALKKRRDAVTREFAVHGKNVELLCGVYLKYEGLEGLKREALETVKEIQKEIDALNKTKNTAVVDTQRAVAQAIDKTWTKLQKDDLDLQLYKIKATVNVAKRVVSVTNYTAKLVLSGGTYLKAWASLVNEMIGLVKTLKKLCEGFDSYFNSLLKEVAGLEAQFEKLRQAIRNDARAGKAQKAKYRLGKMKNWFGKGPAAKLIKRCDEGQAKLTALRKAADAASNGAVKLLDETEDLAKLAKKLALPKMAQDIQKQAAPKTAKMLDAAFKLQEGYTVRQTKLDRTRAHLQQIHVLTRKYQANYYKGEEVSSEDLEKWAKEVGACMNDTQSQLKAVKGELKGLAVEMGFLAKTLKKAL